MKSLTIQLEDNKMDELQKKAMEFGLSTQELVKAAFDDLLSRPSEEFEDAMDYVLNKNKGLYKRLS